MRVGDAMTRGYETTTPTTTLQAAALRMREASVGMLPVLEGDRVLGIVTDRDVTVRGTANGLDPKRSTVGDVMTRAVVCCSEDDSTDDARRVMEQRTIRRLVVIDRAGRMTGVISVDDIAALGAEDEAGPAPDARGRRRAS